VENKGKIPKQRPEENNNKNRKHKIINEEKFLISMIKLPS
jgi:hypothetical protein